MVAYSSSVFILMVTSCGLYAKTAPLVLVKDSGRLTSVMPVFAMLRKSRFLTAQSSWASMSSSREVQPSKAPAYSLSTELLKVTLVRSTQSLNDSV